jgi:glucose/mannose-6-phosphate isomerase
MGLGYSVFSIIVALNKIGFFDIKESEIEEVIKFLKEENEKYIPEINLENNLAKQIASKIFNKIPTYITSEFLNGNGHIMRNQTNENGKHFAFMLDTPELNHYSMEGLAHPKKNTENLIFLIFNSDIYHPRIQKRNQLTEKIIKENGIEVIAHKLNGGNKLIQAMEMLQLGTWITYYLGMLNEVDPVEIPWVDMFKKELG